MNPLDMVVRLLGDASSFMGMVKQAQDTVSKVVQDVQKGAQRIEEITQSLGNFVDAAVNGIAALGIRGKLQEAFQLYTVQEGAELRLRAALRASGQEVENNYQALTQYASALQKVTIHGDEVTIGLMQEAVSFGLTAAQAQKATRNALALADANQIGVGSALRLAAGLEKGITQGFDRWIPALRRVQDPIRRVAIIQADLAKRFEVSKQIADTAAGRFTQLGNDLGDLKEQFGAVVAEGIKPFVQPLQELIYWIQSLSPETKRLAVFLASLYASLLLIGPVFRTLTVLGFAFFNPVTLLLTLAGTLTYQWVQQVGGLVPAWERLKEVAIPVLEGLWERLKEAYGATLELLETTRQFVDDNREVAAILATVVLVVGTVVLVYKALTVAITTTLALLTFLKISQIISTGLWLAWSAAVLIAKGVVLLWNLAMAAAEVLLNLVIFGFLTAIGVETGFSLSTLAATVAVWLLNAALTTLVSLLTAGVALLVVFVAGFVLLLPPILAVIGVVSGLMSAVTFLFKAFDKVPGLAYPLTVITDIFKEWGEVLKLIHRAMTVDIQLAFQVMAAGWELALAQMQALWTPLWQFLKQVAVASFELITAEFKNRFWLAIVKVQEQLVELLDFTGFFAEQVTKIRKSLEDKANVDTFENVKKAKEAFESALEGFEYQETDRIRAARETLSDLSEMVDIKEIENARKARDAQDKKVDGYRQEYQLKQALKMQNASLFQSAEALAKTITYRERLLYGPEGGIYQGRPVAPLGAEAVRAHTTYMEETKRRQMEGGRSFVPLPPGTLVPGSPIVPFAGPQPGPMVPAGGAGSAGDRDYKDMIGTRLEQVVKLLTDIAKKPAPPVPAAGFNP